MMKPDTPKFAGPERFTKKPVTIEAFQITDELAAANLIDHKPLPFGLHYANASWHPDGPTIHYFNITIDTLEGKMTGGLGDWIIKGVKGELYPCKPDIFEASYSRADLAAAPKPYCVGVDEIPAGQHTIAHDGFTGDVIGHYVTREGKRGVVLQQVGTRVVHVYGEKWLAVKEKS